MKAVVGNTCKACEAFSALVKEFHSDLKTVGIYYGFRIREMTYDFRKIYMTMMCRDNL